MRFAAMFAWILVLALVGCGSANRAVGMYDGTVRVSVPKPAVVGGTGPDDQVQVLDQKVTLDLRADQSFSQDLGPIKSEGKWQLEGDQITLTPSKVTINGQTLPRETPKMYNPVIMTLEGDKVTLRREGEEHIYTRQ